MWKSFNKSLSEYALSLGYWGWIVAVGFVLSLVGGYLDISGNLNVPTWLWLVLLLAVLAIAPFIAFHKLRIKRDELQTALDTKKRRKAIADRMAEFYISGTKLQQTITKKDFDGDALAMSKRWATQVVSYFRVNPDELGESRTLSFIPDTSDLVTLSIPNVLELNEDTYYAHILIVTQLGHLKKLVEEFLK